MTLEPQTLSAEKPRSVAIMQPTFLPWVGYFALMDRVDRFVFLDDVQFDKRSWQQRNRILTANGPLWLTAPVLTKGRRHQTLGNTQLQPDVKFQDTVLKTLAHAYAKAPYYAPVIDRVQPVLEAVEPRLCALNIKLIQALAELMGLRADCVLSSDTPVHSSKAQRLADLCKAHGATDYISPPGSKDYLEGDEALSEAGIKLHYFTYEHPIWTQCYQGFTPYLSALDLVMNDLPNALSVIRSGVRAEVTG